MKLVSEFLDRFFLKILTFELLQWYLTSVLWPSLPSKIPCCVSVYAHSPLQNNSTAANKKILKILAKKSLK